MKNDITTELPGVRTNVPLADYTSFHIGGPARYFFEASSVEGIVSAVKVARKHKLPFFLLGDGTNLLAPDKGFLGLVIHVTARKISVSRNTIEAEAGAMFSELVAKAASVGLVGLEWAGGLPGTVGGAVRGNAGAFGGEVKDSLKEATALSSSGEVRIFMNKKCEFQYRSSIFKTQGWIVLSAEFALQKGDKKYILKEVESHIAYRKEKHPLEFPNAGSIFKNCDLKKVPTKLHAQLEHVIKTDPFLVVPTAYLISEAGLKGLRVGGAEVSRKHPNYIVNRGHASSRDVKTLIAKIKLRVKKKFGVVLQEEITIL